MSTERTLALIVILCVISLIDFSHCRGNMGPPVPRQITAGKVDLSVPFVPNEGQLDAKVAYYSHTSGCGVFVTKEGEIVYVPILPHRSDRDPRDRNALFPWIAGFGKSLPFPEEVVVLERNVALREEFVGGNLPHARGEDPDGGVVNLFLGDDPAEWKRGIPSFRTVSLGEVYEGIEVKLRVSGKTVEKVFVVHPGADPDKMRIRLSGADRLRVDRSGGLEALTSLANVEFTRPVAYQEGDHGRIEVPVAYRVSGDEYGFRTGEYDRDRALVIDPLLSSTCIGGSGTDGLFEVPSAIDAEGNIYVASRSNSTDFPPVAGSYCDSISGGYDIFVSKFDSDLTTHLATTFVGGSGNEGLWPGTCMALGAQNDLYISAKTTSLDLPVTPGAYDEDYHWGEDIFVARLSDDLSELLALTYVGGIGRDRIHAMTADERGYVFLTGNTNSSDFPFTPDAYDTTLESGGYFGVDIFVSILDPELSTLTASTFLGGTQDDYTEAIATDSEGSVYLTGWVASADFPTTEGAFDRLYNGHYYDAFISKFNPDLTELSASTFVGGSSWDFGYGMILDDQGCVYITGHTASGNYPWTPGVYDTAYTGIGGPGYGDDSFVSKFGGDLDTLIASTFLGSWNWEIGTYMAIDGAGNVFVAGHTTSETFPTTPGAYDEVYNGGESDVCVSKFDPDLRTLLASTFFGGNDNEHLGSMFLDGQGNVVLAGPFNSADFPFTPGCFDTSYNGGGENWGGENRGGDVFISRLDPDLSADVTGITDGDTGNRLVFATSLRENYPNPFNPSTTIEFTLEDESRVTLRIYDVRGRLVRTLEDGMRRRGLHTIAWDGRDDRKRTVSSGVYLYRLEVDDQTATKKMILAK